MRSHPEHSQCGDIASTLSVALILIEHLRPPHMMLDPPLTKPRRFMRHHKMARARSQRAAIPPLTLLPLRFRRHSGKALRMSSRPNSETLPRPPLLASSARLTADPFTKSIITFPESLEVRGLWADCLSTNRTAPVVRMDVEGRRRRNTLNA
ncbi:hypothetical protein BD309DRAFT_260689 [Dichomitus squalens]|uniref:Uncharacterized protein n=1 Tax=Dichomitus squalens TaxID=114155 RepID=A0A4Q9NQC0_9APHY|nr:hypothetical protein BD309DRAFT_260689 [Dichomitus squalens]TBU56717.1 hypothetical protein BD310DRAFT_601313 [Dichomitus squalens]